ncbi:MAG TPA: hypothetical protein DIT99_31980 [Candidatus Latescibacteria bacterium]|nr:hypothetical protein [Candidatus Latescibacterota bacterium]
MLLKIFVYVVIMILSACAVLMGIIMYVMAEADVPHRGMGIVLSIAGLTICMQSIRTLIRLNREYQRIELKKVLDNPDQILIQWEDEQHIPFEAFYSKLTSLQWLPPTLTLNMEQGAAGWYIHKTIELKVPDDKFRDLEPVVDVLQAANQSDRKDPV